jgi:hypothetical protein
LDYRDGEKRLLAIAKCRLEMLPGAFKRFELHTKIKAVTGEIALFKVFRPFGDVLAADVLDPIKAFDRRALEYIDSWAEKEYRPQITPLSPRVTPLSPPLAISTPAPTRPAAATPHKASRKGWRVALPYIVRVQREGRYRTCNELFNALESQGSEPGAPIVKGTGDQHRGRLYVVELGKSFELKTFQNAWPEIREAAADG